MPLPTLLEFSIIAELLKPFYGERGEGHEPFYLLRPRFGAQNRQTNSNAWTVLLRLHASTTKHVCMSKYCGTFLTYCHAGFAIHMCRMNNKINAVSITLKGCHMYESNKPHHVWIDPDDVQEIQNEHRYELNYLIVYFWMWLMAKVDLLSRS